MQKVSERIERNETRSQLHLREVIGVSNTAIAMLLPNLERTLVNAQNGVANRSTAAGLCK